MTLSLADGLFWASVACCLVAQLLIVRSVIGTRSASPLAGLPRSRAAVELFWAVLPAIALAVLLFFTWRAVRANASAPASSPSSSPTVTVPA